MKTTKEISLFFLKEPNGVAVPAAKAKAKADALALHLVVDTNIFLCHLNFVRALADDRRRPLRLHVAWTVLQVRRAPLPRPLRRPH